MPKISIFWFRRDLRMHDNAGLYHALKAGTEVLPLFIFDREILDKLEDKDDARVSFLHRTITELSQEVAKQGSSIQVAYGKPLEVWQKLLEQYEIDTVYSNHDYEPYAKQRDAAIAQLVSKHGVSFKTYKDHVIFEKQEVEKKSGGPYTVFTPYSRMWKAKLSDRMANIKENGKEVPISYYLKPYPTAQYFHKLYQTVTFPIPNLASMGFSTSELTFPSTEVSRGIIRNYDKTRNFPAQDGTSHLGIHFRFGTISIREKARRALGLNETFLNELIWRDFYAQILANFPHVATQSFRKKYDRIEWRNNEVEFAAWCMGKTGYPIVDAGMRQLNATGYMHNRVRMVVASFLTKHLLIDWRWGEAYFARKLLDFDLASNNGGWQWASGSGTDAAPYFRIFNPTSQQVKFDKDYKYIKEWVPEFGTPDYPEPLVDHKLARERCLATYKQALDNETSL